MDLIKCIYSKYIALNCDNKEKIIKSYFQAASTPMDKVQSDKEKNAAPKIKN